MHAHTLPHSVASTRDRCVDNVGGPLHLFLKAWLSTSTGDCREKGGSQKPNVSVVGMKASNMPTTLKELLLIQHECRVHNRSQNPIASTSTGDSYGRKVVSQSTEYAYEFYLGQNVSDVTWITLTSLVWAYRILSFLNYLKRGFRK